MYSYITKYSKVFQNCFTFFHCFSIFELSRECLQCESDEIESTDDVGRVQVAFWDGQDKYYQE